MPRLPTLLTTLSPLLTLTTAVNFECNNIRQDKVSWDLSALGGPQTVWHSYPKPPSLHNTTFLIDICKPLDKQPDLAKEEQCATGTRVCATDWARNTVEDGKWTIDSVVSIAGMFLNSGRSLDPKIERLKGSASNSDSEREGLRVTLGGGKVPDKRSGVDQRAVIEFECDQKRSGLEDGSGKEKEGDGKKGEKHGKIGNGKDDEKREEGGKEDGDDDGEKDSGKDRSLTFISFKREDNKEGGADVLRLNWRTKYACEEVEDDDRVAKGGWGFFGWLFFIVFLGAAAYLIFGSWLNYSRYGARGWDLVPHGDTIRDLPYIVSDWGRSVVDTVQGRGYRGGYSAV